MINVEIACEKDYQIIEDIGRKSLPIYYNKMDLFILNLSQHTILKIIDDNNIVGYLIHNTFKKDKRIHIMSIGILEEYRRKNLGTKLIEYLKNSSEYQISLYVQISNETAIAFYKKNSFEINKEIINYYDNLDVKNAYYMTYQPEINKNNLSSC